MIEKNVDIYRFCKYCENETKCIDKDKIEKVAKEIETITETNENTSNTTDTLLMFKCMSYRSKQLK